MSSERPSPCQARQTRPPRRTLSGFTLLEVMVAVAIFAGIAVAITDTTSSRVNNLLSIRDMTLASFVAENRMTDIQLAGGVPAPGETRDTTELANTEWSLLTTVEKTPFPEVMRIEIAVSKATTPDAVIYRLTGIQGPN